MKKRFLTLIVTITAMLACLFGFIACEDSATDDDKSTNTEQDFNNSNSSGGNTNGGSSNSNVPVSYVTLNRSNLTLEVGDSASLYETIYPSNATDKSVTWSSSNTSVATVSNGTVVARSAGTATITVRTSNYQTATCTVTVSNPVSQTVAVSSVSLNQSSATMEVGDTLSLTATVSPNNATDKSVTWSSSNTSVATVNGGMVIAQSAGTATITVRTSNYKTATCTVTVSNPASQTVAVSSVSLNQTSATLEVGDTLSLTATVNPSNATDKSVTWSSSNTSVATVSNGTVTAQSAGTATITVRTSNNKTATCEISVCTAEVLPTSIYLNKTAIELDENAQETLTVTILPSNATDKNIEWIVLDTSVATVSAGTVTAVGGGETTLIATTSNGLTATCTITVKAQFEFEVYGDGYALKAYNGTATEVTVPSTYKGKNVIAIGVQPTTLPFVPSGFANCTSVQKIILPDTISTIQYAAFYNCINLKSINIPNGVQLWGYYALSNCNALEEISVSLDKFLFETFFVKATETDYQIPKSLKTVKITGTRVPVNAFCELETSITHIEISDSVTTIGDAAFSGCDSLTSVTIGNSVTTIGEYAFYDCDSLTSVTIPNSVTTIGNYAFYHCDNLTSITIPDSVTTIGGNAFWMCISLTIYCEVESKPDGWGSYWNSGCPVVWGYKG